MKHAQKGERKKEGTMGEMKKDVIGVFHKIWRKVAMIVCFVFGRKNRRFRFFFFLSGC